MIPTLPPLEVLEGDVYENRDLKCGRCGAFMRQAPWCKTSAELKYRPRCPYCGSMATYPANTAVPIEPINIPRTDTMLVVDALAQVPTLQLVFPTEHSRERAAEVLSDLIQRINVPELITIYQHHLERVRQAKVERHESSGPTPLGPYPSH